MAAASDDGLNGFTLNNIILSQNSGCSVGGYSSNTAISATVSAGKSYSFTVTLLSANYNEGVAIWADLNHNHIFETNLGELLYQTPSLRAGQFSGTLTLPGNLASRTTGPANRSSLQHEPELTPVVTIVMEKRKIMYLM